MRRKCGGFTLIEVIGALVIFATGILLAGGLSSGLSNLLRASTLRTEAAGIGTQVLDSLAVVSYATLAEGETNGGNVTVNGRSYSRHWMVFQSTVRVRQVDVTIRFEGDDVFTGTTFVVEPW